jgi:hypothetical protein
MSKNYDLFARAMIESKQVACVFKGRPRVLSIIILGHADGEERALAWQTAGKSAGRLPGWRNITLSEVTDVRLLDSELQRGTRKSGEQHWVADVDLDVNPDSPYHPRRSIPRRR